MKRNHTKKSCLALGVGVVVLASTLLWSTPLIAYDYSISGESTTIFRMRTTIDDKKNYPAYEYLRLSLIDNSSDGSGISFYFGGWGRADLADKSSGKATDADLQYAYLTYRAPTNNTLVTIGRQFISEGVATERIDGLYLRNDFKYGFGASAFVGNSVITEPNLPNLQGGGLIYGTRITQSMPKYYTVGLSALRSERENSTRYREEEGFDIWLHPLVQVDLTGRSSYNSITKGWMEHAYSATYTVLPNLSFGADLSGINYKDYFYNVTTKALSLTNGIISPNEKLLMAGASVTYLPIKELTLTANYKNHNYRIAGNADYFGGKATYSLPESFSAGVGMFRMEGSGRLRYTETRAFASKKLGKASFTADYINVWYDKRINGIRNSYVITGSAGYEIKPNLKVGADVEYSKSPDFNNEVRGLVKLTYAFDAKLSNGGSKSEK